MAKHTLIEVDRPLYVRVVAAFEVATDISEAPSLCASFSLDREGNVIAVAEYHKYVKAKGIPVVVIYKVAEELLSKLSTGVLRNHDCEYIV